MLKPMPSSAKDILTHLQPMENDIREFIVKQNSIIYNVTSANDEFMISMSGDYRIISIIISKTFPWSNKTDFEIQLINLLNSLIEKTINQTKEGINESRNKKQLTTILKNAPKEMVDNIGAFQKEYADQIKELEITENTYISENNIFNIIVTGGLKFLSVNITKEKFNPENIDAMETELQNILNKIFDEARENIRNISKESQKKIFSINFAFVDLMDKLNKRKI